MTASSKRPRKILAAMYVKSATMRIGPAGEEISPMSSVM